MVSTSRATHPGVLGGVSVMVTSTGVWSLPLTFTGDSTSAAMPMCVPLPPVRVVTFVPLVGEPEASDTSVKVWLGVAPVSPARTRGVSMAAEIPETYRRHGVSTIGSIVGGAGNVFVHGCASYGCTPRSIGTHEPPTGAVPTGAVPIGTGTPEDWSGISTYRCEPVPSAGTGT